MIFETLAPECSTDFSLGPLIGRSPEMLRVFEMIRIAAATRSPVLILGETGTGKELVARAIHEFGPWRKEPFVPVDCPALAPTLIESELFGHVRGAFTGAISHHRGLLRSAAEGSLFLDEIAELPLELQARLLRTIEEHECKPVGSTSRVRFNARILAATHRNPVSGIREGSFREDLYFRLNVLSITLPPLRERKMDIPLIAERMLSKFRRSMNGTAGPLAFSQEALDIILEYRWPGNVRELRNVLERAVACCNGPLIQAADLRLIAESPFLLPGSNPDEHIILLKELEQRAILRALSACGGDKVLAARLLGIGKTTLYRRLQAWCAPP